MTTHQLTGSEWHDGARVRAVWKSYPVRQETRYSTTYATSARHPRSSSDSLQARWVSGHQAIVLDLDGRAEGTGARRGAGGRVRTCAACIAPAAPAHRTRSMCGHP